MQELSEKLKNQLVDNLINKHDADEPYMYTQGRKWTRREIAEEVKNETEFGVNQMTSLLMLSLDLLARNKVKQ